jgi:hypothetical protein
VNLKPDFLHKQNKYSGEVRKAEPGRIAMAKTATRATKDKKKPKAEAGKKKKVAAAPVAAAVKKA